MIVWPSQHSHAKLLSEAEFLTAMAVAGRNTMVSSEMLFMADESRFVSRATSCCMRLYG
jgi:hypothetical protein